MLAWLSEYASTIIISAVILAVVVLIIRAMVRGKLGCSGDCASCKGSAVSAEGSGCGDGCASCRFSGKCRDGQ